MPFSLPDGWPVSLWFFLITAIVYLLQRFPLTGVFLMIVGAAFWSIVLINLGMAGLAIEAITRRCNLLWLLVPALYVGGYYWAYANDLKTLAFVAEETVRFNAGKSLAFDPERQDLIIEVADDGLGMRADEFVERFGLADSDPLAWSSRSDLSLLCLSGASAGAVWRTKHTPLCRGD